MTTHELAQKLLALPNIEVLIPYDPDNRDMIQPLENWINASSGTVGSSEYPYKESIMFRGKVQNSLPKK